MLESLSQRQREVCDLLALGLVNKEIANRLGISARTVEEHRSAVYKKLGVRNIVELVRLMLGANPVNNAPVP